MGVWVGNFDGSVMHGVSGVAGAGQIFTDIMNLLHAAPTGVPPQEFSVPPGLRRVRICTASGKLPGPVCRRTINEWFMNDRVPVATCDIHRAFRVRGEDGVLQTKVFEVYGPEYDAWAAGEMIPVPPADARPVEYPALQHHNPEEMRTLAILSPSNGDIYKLDPVLRREYQTIRIVGAVPERASDVHVRIDGSLNVAYAEGGVRWPLQRGAHTFQLVGSIADRRVESNAVIIHVE